MTRVYGVDQDGGEEADDEASGKEVAKPHMHQRPASNLTPRGSLDMFGRNSSFGKMPGLAEESPWEALNEVGSICRRNLVCLELR